MPDLFQAGLITHSTASAQGQSAMAAADAVLNADYSELAQSPKFQQTFLSIDADPQHAQLTDRQKMDLAKERVADEVRAQLATDPELLAVNAMAAKLGDAQLFNLVTRGTAKTVKSGIVRNATEQGQSREPSHRPARSAMAREKLCTPSSPSSVRCRMSRPVRTAAARAK